MRAVYGLRVRGKENLPSHPYILVANHNAKVDPLLINLALFRKRIYFLAAQKLFECPAVLQWMLRQVGCLPSISPVVDSDNLYETACTLKRNEIIGFFAQGKIHGDISGFKTGAVVLALRTGFPVVPAYVSSAGAFRGRSRVNFGEPIVCDITQSGNAEYINELNEQIRKQVIMLSQQ